jgi:pyruvate ferredoxin oxidoreductase gamma subunit
MIEIRLHGRGGQGSVVASELLAQAAFLDGKLPQCFPFFGVERRGAPVTAFARIDDRPIALRTSIARPDIVVVLDTGLLSTVPVTDGLKEGGLLLANTPLPPSSISAPSTVRVATVDARKIALAHGLGSAMMPIVNTAMLGALARVSGVVSMEAVDRAIETHVPSHPSENRAAASDGFAQVRVARASAPAAPPIPPAPRVTTPLPDGPVASISSAVLRTSAWRTMRPVIHLDRCTRCNFCWKFCPDDAFEFDPSGFPVLRPEYCKGCGICAEECPPGAIEMVAE